MATIAKEDRVESDRPQECNSQPCFRCNGTMHLVEFKVPIHSIDKKGYKTVLNKTMYAYVCTSCKTETSLTAHIETAIRHKRELTKHYEDLRHREQEIKQGQQ